MKPLISEVVERYITAKKGKMYDQRRKLQQPLHSISDLKEGDRIRMTVSGVELTAVVKLIDEESGTVGLDTEQGRGVIQSDRMSYDIGEIDSMIQKGFIVRAGFECESPAGELKWSPKFKFWYTQKCQRLVDEQRPFGVPDYIKQKLVEQPPKHYIPEEDWDTRRQSYVYDPKTRKLVPQDKMSGVQEEREREEYEKNQPAEVEQAAGCKIRHIVVY